MTQCCNNVVIPLPSLSTSHLAGPKYMWAHYPSILINYIHLSIGPMTSLPAVLETRVGACALPTPLWWSLLFRQEASKHPPIHPNHVHMGFTLWTLSPPKIGPQNGLWSGIWNLEASGKLGASTARLQQSPCSPETQTFKNRNKTTNFRLQNRRWRGPFLSLPVCCGIHNGPSC
jgi:hypothetical protein